MEGLKDSGVPTEVASFLTNWANVLHSKYILSIQSCVYKLLAENAETTQVQLLRAALYEATAPLYAPLASFPVCMPESEATQAVWLQSVRKGPLLHSPVPQPYLDMGHKILRLPEAVRANLKTEWFKLDVLLLEALQGKGVSMANDAVAGMEVQRKMLDASRQLDQMRARLCHIHSGIVLPVNAGEYREWIKVYETHVLARMLKAKQKADGEYSEHQAAALSSGEGTQGSAQSRVADKALLDYEALQSELAQRAYMVYMCMHLYICAYTNTYMRTYIYICAHLIYMYIYVNMHIYREMKMIHDIYIDDIHRTHM